MKNNQGVTMMQIVITVIVMIILLSIAIYYGQGTTKEATIAAFYNEIREVTSAIQEANALNQIKISGDNIVFYGETSAPRVEKTEYQEQLENAGEGEFYYLDFTTTKNLKNTLELENVKSDYILHYNTLKVYMKDGVTLIDETGKEVIKYSADEVISYYNNLLSSSQTNNNTYTIRYDANGGSNAPSNQFANAGSSINITTSEPMRSGYKFAGWSISKNASAATYQPGVAYTPTTNVTFYAVWELASNLLTVEMNDYKYGGSKSEPSLVGSVSGLATYYYNDVDSNAGGYAWTNVKDSTTLSVGTYYMYALVENQATPTVQFKVNQAEGSIGYNKNLVNKALGDEAFTNVLTKTGDGTVLYSSSNLSVATVNLKGAVTIVGVGETTITAIVEDGKNYTYPTKNASYALVVNRGEISATVKMEGYTYAGTVSTPSVDGNVENGDVTYYYNTSNSNSNGIEWKDITPTSLNAGTYYMYAVIAETENHEAFTTQPVEFTVEKADAKLSLASKEINKKTSDDPFTNELTDTGNGTIKYSSANTAVATVNQNGEVTIQGAGEAIIVATVTPSLNYKYEYTTITYTIKVTKATPYLMSRDLNTLSYVLGYGRTGCSTTYTASSIKTVTFKNTKTAPANYVATWNVSSDGKNAVKAWVVPTTENSALYDMYIGADLDEDEKIIASNDCTALFMYYSSLNAINGIELLDMSKVTSTRAMFCECTLQKLDLSSWNTTNLSNIQDMFAYNKSLTELNMNIDVSKVTNAHGVFFECSNLTQLTLGDFNLANASDMDYLFYNCNKLKSIDGKLTTKAATSMVQVFYQCKNLESIDLSAVKTSQVTTMSSMFAECTNLKKLDLSSFDTSKVENMAKMFYRCENLANLDLSSFDTRNLTDMHEMFYDSDNLAIIKLGKNFDKINGTSMFSYCSNLKSIITLRDEPITLATTVYLNSDCALYVMSEDAERAFESGENYLTVFGNSSKDTIRDDGSTDIYRIRTILELVGDTTTYVEIGNEYTEQGVKVAGMTVNADGTYTPFGYTVSSSIKDRSGNTVTEIDTSKAGTYTVTYKLSDENGEVVGAEVSRTVKVTMIHSVANGPVLNTSEMKAVYWNEDGTEFETTSFALAETEEGTIYNTTLYNYNYSFDDDVYELGTDTYDVEWALKPRWANAKTISDGSYWVWIPRYAYKITYYTGSDKKTVSETKTQYGSIDVIFLKDKSNNEYIDKNGDTQTLPTGYIVHPAFQAMSEAEATEGNRLGKWSEELEGIWVAKYEASQEISENGTDWTTKNIANGTEGNILTTNAANAINVSGTSDTQVRVVSKHSVKSWRYSYVSKMYENCLYMNETLNTHQMKNSEWGAVAYLTYSVYGRNGNELAVNQCKNYYTGAGTGKGSTYVYDENTFSDEYAYNTTQGKLTSTTGNIYGIYDMSGGAWECTASYVNNRHENLVNYGYNAENSRDNLVNVSEVARTIENMKTKQIYESDAISGENTQDNDYGLNSDIYGDAVYETSTSCSSDSNDSWCSDYSGFPYSNDPFFGRGGYCYGASGSGIFGFHHGYDGGSYLSGSGFRPVICITSND